MPLRSFEAVHVQFLSNVFLRKIKCPGVFFFDAKITVNKNVLNTLLIKTFNSLSINYSIYFCIESFCLNINV